jgi:hypothetical protein
VRVAPAGLGHEPELVAARLRARQLVARQHMAGLAAAGGILAAADLDLEVLEARAELGGEEEVEHLAALGLGVVGQEARRGSRANGPDPFKEPARRSPVDLDWGRAGRASGRPRHD